MSPPAAFLWTWAGTAGRVAQASHTEISRYRINGEDHYANASDPYIILALAPIVSGFRSLNDFHPRPRLHQPGHRSS